MSKLFWWGVSTVAALAVSQATVAAEDLEEIVVKAQRTQEGSIGGWLPVPLPELPRSVTVLDEESINRMLVSTTKDIIKNVAGVQILPDNNLQGYQTPIIRGIQSSMYFEGQYSAGVITSIPEVIASAEVLQGFNSLQFAADAGGGSVNVFMKRPTGSNFLQTELQATNWGGAKLVLDGNAHMGPGETDGIRFVGVVDRDQSYVENYPRKEGNAGSIMARYSGFGGVQIDLDVSVWDIKNARNGMYFEFSSPPNGSIPDLDPRKDLYQDWSENARRKGHQLGLKLTKQFSDNWRALVAVAYDRTEYFNYQCNVRNPDFVTGEADYSCSNSPFGPLWDKQVRFDLTGSFELFGMRHETAMGFRQSGQDWRNLKPTTNFDYAPYTRQNIYNPRSYPVPPTGNVVPNQYRSMFDDQLFYFQDRIALAPKFDLWAGVGYIENDGSHGPHGIENQLVLTHAVVPTGALVFKPTEWSNYYFSYSEGLSRAEVVGTNDVTIVNPGEVIPAVHSKAYEVGAKWTLAKRLQLNLAVFQMEQPFTLNETVSDSPPLFRRTAGGLNQYNGVSIDFRGKLARNLDIQGGFTVLEAEQKETPLPALDGNDAPGVARRSGSVNLLWDVGQTEGLSFDGGIQYQSSMPLNAQNTYTLDGFTKVDLGAGYTTVWNDTPVRLRLLLENALDDDFYYGFQNGFQLAAPRTLKVALTTRF